MNTPMTPSAARELLVAAADTHTGRDALRALGYGAIIGHADRGDDDSTVKIAQELREELARRYGL